MPKQMPWSYSRLKDFEQCPWKFKGKYVTKEFPTADFNAPHLKRGKMMHKAIEMCLKTKDWEYIDDKRNLNLSIDGESVLKHSMLFLKPLISKLIASDGLDTEDSKAFTAQRTPTDWLAKDVWVRVIMDVMALSDPETLVILDWKSGKVFDKVDQLRLCAGAGMALHPQVKKVVVAYIWLDHPTAKPLVAEYTRDDYESIWEEFGDRAELIQLSVESGEWAKQPSAYNCKWCEALTTQCEHKGEFS